MKHELKSKPEYFQAMITGEKTSEIRLNDRNFQPGDFVCLKEYVPSAGSRWDGDASTYTGRQLTFCISYVLADFEGLAPGYVLLCFEPILPLGWRVPLELLMAWSEDVDAGFEVVAEEIMPMVEAALKYPPDDSCLAKLKHGEPYFVLRAQDALAPGIIAEWVRQLQVVIAQDVSAGARTIYADPKVRGALRIADDMEAWAKEHPTKVPD